MRGREICPTGTVAGRICVPPSKSLTNRHLNLALLARHPTLLETPLLADDTRRFVDGLRQLGFSVSGSRELLTLTPVAKSAAAKIDCGASGTMLRFLTATLCTVPGEWIVDGTERLRQRPVAALLGALARLGAEIESRDGDGKPPLRIRGGGLTGGRVVIPARESSQFVSALVMAAARASDPVVIEIEGLVSKPYVDLTLQAMAEWGGEVETRSPARLTVHPRRLRGGRVTIEADYSSACYFAAGAALLGGSVTLVGLTPDSAQADRRFLDVLAAMGARCRWSEREVTVSGETLTAVDVDMADLPDQVPTLAALAPFARGETRIRNVAHARLKESDRLSAMVRGLAAAGVAAISRPDGIVVPGAWAEKESPTSPVCIDPVDDHRIAMSFAVMGLRRRGLSIADPQVVEKSYPDFWHDFHSCFEAAS